uniref:Protein kinase domain-containing protein n=1 Tax=Salix viminalis TaxID=40686 RepID=A0A6N2KZN0_SALVM
MFLAAQSPLFLLSIPSLKLKLQIADVMIIDGKNSARIHHFLYEEIFHLSSSEKQTFYLLMPQDCFVVDLYEMEDVELLQLDFGTISAATGNFSEFHKLGQGGFGGTLTSGQDIAVKRLSMKSGQGEKEFKNEVMLVAKLQHRNLVRLLGFCFEKEERILVYEFLPNSSLNNLIFGIFVIRFRDKF